MDGNTRLSFEERIRRCARLLSRDQLTALGTLYDLTSARLFRFCLLLTRNQADAEDAIQAAMLRIARRPSLLSNADSPWAYFLRVVRNEAINIVRRRNRTAPIELASGMGAWDENTLDQMESEREVRLGLKRLPPEQAEVIVLKIWEEMTFSEISQVLGQSPNTVASRYRYAVQKLQQILSSHRTDLAGESAHSDPGHSPVSQINHPHGDGVYQS